MGRKLRVFISSTMKDLRNERFAVCERLSSFNLDVVNAEGLTPNGTKSWGRIESEIESSDLFVLILGSTYGWIPTSGPKAGLDLSVTHLELKYAQELDIPVLPFLKKLEYGSDKNSEDAKKRDNFRQEIQDWDGGYFTTSFDLAFDLAHNVGNSIMSLLMDGFQKARVKNRSLLATESAMKLTGKNVPEHNLQISSLPFDLVNAVKNGQAILFAGAGVSLSAGLPSAPAFAQSLIKLVRENDSNYSVNPTGSAFAGVATDLSALRGREFLVGAIKEIIDSPQGIEPTKAHMKAVELFGHILTTNYDNLFESALSSLKLKSDVVASEIEGPLPERAIIKLHGSIDIPNTLLLTELEAFMFDQDRPLLWSAVIEEMKKRMIIVVGASLHDPSIIRLFKEAGEDVGGYFVVPELWKSTPNRVGTWNLKCIKADADSFMTKLYEEVTIAKNSS